MFVTEYGKLEQGLHAATGDQIAVLHGCVFPVLFRPTDDGRSAITEIVYLEKTMHGESEV